MYFQSHYSIDEKTLKNKEKQKNPKMGTKRALIDRSINLSFQTSTRAFIINRELNTYKNIFFVGVNIYFYKFVGLQIKRRMPLK